jgi:hypothetical protein
VKKAVISAVLAAVIFGLVLIGGPSKKGITKQEIIRNVAPDSPGKTLNLPEQRRDPNELKDAGTDPEFDRFMKEVMELKRKKVIAQLKSEISKLEREASQGKESRQEVPPPPLPVTQRDIPAIVERAVKEAEPRRYPVPVIVDGSRRKALLRKEGGDLIYAEEGTRIDDFVISGISADGVVVRDTVTGSVRVIPVEMERKKKEEEKKPGAEEIRAAVERAIKEQTGTGGAGKQAGGVPR